LLKGADIAIAIVSTDNNNHKQKKQLSINYSTDNPKLLKQLFDVSTLKNK